MEWLTLTAPAPEARAVPGAFLLSLAQVPLRAAPREVTTLRTVAAAIIVAGGAAPVTGRRG
ncbi:MAG: hypothetical protein ACE5JJ_01925 [Nitrospinota bacterium]